MVARSKGSVLAAVNADFFTPEGGALGTEVVDGRVTSARERPALAWRRGQEPWMGVVDVEGDSLYAGWPLALHDSDGSDGTTEIVGGYPELLDSGGRVGDLAVMERPSFAAARNPRTAVGFDASTHRLWLLVVDGRQAPYSVGMTLPELADLLEAFGATDAINLDGGGSSVIVCRWPRSQPSIGCYRRTRRGERAGPGPGLRRVRTGGALTRPTPSAADHPPVAMETPTS